MTYEQKESNNGDRYYIKKPKRNYGVEKYNNWNLKNILQGLQADLSKQEKKKRF